MQHLFRPVRGSGATPLSALLLPLLFAELWYVFVFLDIFERLLSEVFQRNFFIGSCKVSAKVLMTRMLPFPFSDGLCFQPRLSTALNSSALCALLSTPSKRWVMSRVRATEAILLVLPTLSA